MKSFLITIMFSLAACGQQRQPAAQAPADNADNAAAVAANAEAPSTATEARTEGGVPGEAAESPDKPVLSEPKGPIDPKSVEAAGQVVQSYGALIEQKRLSEAAKLWGNPDAAVSFAKQLRAGAHLEIGELGPTEGAAGSIYTTMPVVFYGDGFRKPANIILRRVNDVPGSTEAQRRWHIERIEWRAA